MTDIPAITTAQMKLLHLLAKEAGVSHPELSASAKKMFGVGSLKDLDIAQAGTLIDDLLPAGAKMPMPAKLIAKPLNTKFPTMASMRAPKPAQTITEAMATGAEPQPPAVDVDPEMTMPLHPDAPEVFEPDNFDDDHDDAPILTTPVMPLPKPPPLYVAPAKPGTIPVRPPNGGGLVATRVAPASPRPSFLKPLPDDDYQRPAPAAPPVTTARVPMPPENRIAPIVPRPSFLRPLVAPASPMPPMPPSTAAPEPAAVVPAARQTGGLGRLRAGVSTDTLPEAGPEHPSEVKAQTQKVPKVSGLTAADIPW
jgi:hypothetical protein